jgi:hypothetical protein
VVIRRKSTQDRTGKHCAYHEQMQYEHLNQMHHEQRQLGQHQHDPTPCWCCCEDCPDLVWYYTPRKGVWWEASASGGLLLMRETCAESPGSPVTRPS